MIRIRNFLRPEYLPLEDETKFLETIQTTSSIALMSCGLTGANQQQTKVLQPFCVEVRKSQINEDIDDKEPEKFYGTDIKKGNVKILRPGHFFLNRLVWVPEDKIKK